MADGILSRIPDVSGLLADAASLEGDIGALSGTFASIADGGADSPVAPVVDVLTNLGEEIDIDLRGLTQQLPDAVGAIRNALPANTIGFVESLGAAYGTAQDFLQDSELVRQIGEGGSIQEAALAFIADALALFESRLGELTDNLIDSDVLDQVRVAATTIQQLRDDFEANQAEFLPFLTDNLLGLGPDLLDGAVAHVDGFMEILAPLDPVNLADVLGDARNQLSGAFAALVSELETFDPEEADAYARIQVELGAIETAASLLFSALETLYQQMEDLIENAAWDALFSTYVSLLESIDVGDVPTLDDFVDTVVEMLEDMLARVLTAFGAEELRDRLALVTQNMRDAVLGSPLAQIRPTLEGFLGEIEQAIEDIPTEAVQESVEEILGRIRTELTNLNLSAIETEIDEAFQSIDTFIQENVGDTLTTAVVDAMTALAGEVERLPLAGLLTELTSAIAQLQVLVDELEEAVGSELDSLENLLNGLETLSFRPVSDEVIAEIDELKVRLQAINPDALSDAEKLAIGAALAILEAIDLEEKVVQALKDGYDEVEAAVKRLLDQIAVALERLKGEIGGFSATVVLDPATGLLDEAAAQVERLNGQLLLSPLYDELDGLVDRLASLSPGSLLAPLQEPYDAVTGTVQRIDPATWVAPLHELYAEIDRLVDLIDVTPLLDELDQRQRDLFADVRSAILSALDAVDLPEPFAGFFAQIRPVVELMTDALFGDPDTALRDLSVEFQTRLDLDALFAPLDEAFGELVALVESVPEEELTTTMNAIRQAIGVGLQVLDPSAVLGRLRSGYGQLEEIAPTRVLGSALSLPALRVGFEARASDAPPERQEDVAAVSARFEAVISLTTPAAPEGRMRDLVASHHTAKEALRLRINSLEASSAAESYAGLRRNVERLLPEFLRRQDPLTHRDIIAGIHAMRPSAKADAFEDALEKLLQQLEPMEEAIEPAFNDFFDLLREIMVMINPLAIRDEVEAVYVTLREKLQILDPEALADAVQPIWDELTAPLDAIDPSALAARLDASFQNALNALAGPVELFLDELSGIIDDQLRAIREAVLDLLDEVKVALSGAVGSVDAILGRIENLVFVGIIERLYQVIENLGVSFEAELERVVAAFNEMLGAIPLDTGGSVGIAA